MLDKTRADAAFHLKTARGQIDGILRMLEEDRYCIDVSRQILAVQSLLKKANLEILEGHIKTCVAHAVKKGDADAKIKEVISIIDKYAKT